MTLWLKACSVAIGSLVAGAVQAQTTPQAPSKAQTQLTPQAKPTQRELISFQELQTRFKEKMAREGQTALTQMQLCKKIIEWPEYQVWSSRNQSKDLPLLPPPFHGTFINSPQLTVEGLRGKVVFINFPFADDSRAQAYMAAQVAKAQQFTDQPVVIINVISGKPASVAQEFVKNFKITWPTIVDEDISYLKSCGLESPAECKSHQYRVISPTGEFAKINAIYWDRELEYYSQQARWRVDPKEITPALKPAWQALEIGQFNQAANLLTTALRGTKDKAAADKIKAVISEELSRALASAEQVETAGQHWQAYKQYQVLLQQFSNATEAKDIKTRVTKLAANPQVALELQADKLLTEAQQAGRSPNAAIQKRAVQLAQQVVREFPGTEAAQRAQTLTGNPAK